MSRELSRRAFLRTLGAGMAATWLAACVPAAPAPEAPKAEQPAAAPPPKRRLVFWGHDQHPIDLAGAGFVKSHPDIEWVSPHPADFGAKMQAAMAAGSDCPDLYWAEAFQAQDWGCAGLLTETTEHLKPVIDQYHPLKVAETFIAKTGQYVGWPGDISVSGWYYRVDKLEELGYGDMDFETWTYDDFAQMSAEIAKKGMYTFCFPGAAWATIFMYVLHQMGGTTLSQDGLEIKVGDEKGIQAMSIVKKLYESGGGLDVEWWSPAYWAALQEGTLIGDFAAAWAKGFWEAQIKSPEQGAGKWRIAKFPTGPGIKYRTGIWGGAQLVSPKCAANRDDAIEFMKYALGSLEGTILVGGWGIIPAYRPYLASKEFLEGRSPIFGDWPFNQFWASQEKELSLEYFRPAGYGAVESAVGKVMPEIMKGEISVEDGMAKIVELATPDVERVMCK